MLLSPVGILTGYLRWVLDPNRVLDALDGLAHVFVFVIVCGTVTVASLDVCAAITYARREHPILATRIYNVISLLWLCAMAYVTFGMLSES